MWQCVCVGMSLCWCVGSEVGGVWVGVGVCRVGCVRVWQCVGAVVCVWWCVGVAVSE